MINHRNQGFENLFALHLIWSNIYIYIYMYVCMYVCMYIVNCKNYKGKITIVYVCERGGKTMILTICSYQSFSAPLIKVQTALLQKIIVLIFPSASYYIFLRPFYVTFTQWRHRFSRNCVNILREMPIAPNGIHKYNVLWQCFWECGLINFKIIPLRYPQRDKPSSRHIITRNYV